VTAVTLTPDKIYGDLSFIGHTLRRADPHQEARRSLITFGYWAAASHRPRGSCR
jgi:hypothetical protein